MKAFLKDLVSSFYAPPFYVDMARHRNGIGVRFMLALTIVFMLPTSLFLYPVARGMVAGAEVLTQKMPQMDFKHGKLSIPVPSPRVIPLGGKLAVGVDTNSSIANLPAVEKRMQEKNLLLLFAADGAVVRATGGSAFRVYSYSGMKKPFVITYGDWKALGAQVAHWGFPAAMLFFTAAAFAGAFLYNLLATFGCAILVSVAGVVMRADIAFDAALRLTAAARFPAAVIAGALGLFASVSWFGWWVLFSYLFFAVFSCRRSGGDNSTGVTP